MSERPARPPEPSDGPEEVRREPPRRRRLGLFGGSFDPIHEGHLHAARAAQRAFGLDRVVFVPAYRSPFKLGHRPAGAEHRLAMVELAIADEPTWSASTLELDRGGASYTIDTVRGLRDAVCEPEDAELFLIVGSDNLPGLPRWRDADELLRLAQPIVVHRDGDPTELLAALREELGEERAARIEAGFLRLPPVEVSSTEVRDELRERDLDGLDERVPQAVLEYVRDHGLYGGE